MIPIQIREVADHQTIQTLHQVAQAPHVMEPREMQKDQLHSYSLLLTSTTRVCQTTRPRLVLPAMRWRQLPSLKTSMMVVKKTCISSGPSSSGEPLPQDGTQGRGIQSIFLMAIIPWNKRILSIKINPYRNQRLRHGHKQILSIRQRGKYKITSMLYSASSLPLTVQ